MKRFLASLTDTSPDHQQLLDAYIHHARTLQRYGVRFVSTADVSTIKNYRKFVLVRHPFDRLLSAYHDKFVHGKSWIWWRKLERKMARRNVTGTQLQRFVKSVLYGFHNAHWSPYAHRCQLDTVDYDDVIRLETFHHDMKPIVEFAHARLSSLVIVSGRQHRRNSTKQGDLKDEALVAPKHLDDYSELQKSDLFGLKGKFVNDLRLFGYDFDVDTLVASCSMTDERGVTCC